jgi:uncharacterized protein (DUF2147 family)
MPVSPAASPTAGKFPLKNHDFQQPCTIAIYCRHGKNAFIAYHPTTAPSAALMTEFPMTKAIVPALVGLCCLLAGRAPAAAPAWPPQGIWLTEDGDGAVEIYDCGKLLCGRIVWQDSTQRPDGSPDIDDHNPDPALRHRPVCGLQIISNLRRSDPTTWGDGAVYDPDSGKTYHVKLTMVGADKLRLRGYIGIPLLGESQLWRRAPADLPLCAAPR